MGSDYGMSKTGSDFIKTGSGTAKRLFCTVFDWTFVSVTTVFVGSGQNLVWSYLMGRVRSWWGVETGSDVIKPEVGPKTSILHHFSTVMSLVLVRFGQNLVLSYLIGRVRLWYVENRK